MPMKQFFIVSARKTAFSQESELIPADSVADLLSLVRKLVDQKKTFFSVNWIDSPESAKEWISIREAQEKLNEKMKSFK